MATISMTGNLTRDPKIFTNDDGTKTAYFSIAENYGKDYEKASYHEVIAYSEVVSQVEGLIKGNRVTVAGQLRTRQSKATFESGANATESYTVAGAVSPAQPKRAAAAGTAKTESGAGEEDF